MWKQKELSAMSVRHIRRLRRIDYRQLLASVKLASRDSRITFIRNLLSEDNRKTTSQLNQRSLADVPDDIIRIENKSVSDKKLASDDRRMKTSSYIHVKENESDKEIKCANEIRNIAEDLKCENHIKNDKEEEIENLITTDEKVTIKESFKNKLVHWTLNYKVKLNCLTAVLGIINTYIPSLGLPKNGKTLMKTPRKVKTVYMSEGKYIHFNVSTQIENNISSERIGSNGTIKLLIGIDGAAYAEKSCQYELWPILGSIYPDNKVFLISCFFGKQKPQSSNEFLEQFVIDINRLLTEGIVHNAKKVKVELMGIVCDIPAKAFICKTKGHTGYDSCPRCHVKGKRLNKRMCFSNFNSPRRTDEEIRLQVENYDSENDDDQFIQGKSILLDIDNFGLISHMPMDYMHLICQGVVPRILNFWLKRKLADTTFIPPIEQQQISKYLISIRKYTPVEFNRKPRELKMLGKWKAIEFRTFLLYTGIVALKIAKSYNGDMEKLFTTLHCSIRLLCSYQSIEDAKYAHNLLKYFLKLFIHMFGEEFVSINVHGLCHLAEEVIRLDLGLDSFSAFQFENHMRHLKMMIRKPEKPLEQIYNRTMETMISNHKTVSKNSRMLKLRNHSRGPLTKSCQNPQFSKIVINNTTYTTSVPDNCCKVRGCIVKIENFAMGTDGKLQIIGRKYKSLTNLYITPCESSLLDIWKVKTLSFKLYNWPVDSISTKYFRLPIPDETNTFAVVPLLHI